MTETFTITRQIIPELPGAGRLGRNVQHDSRSLAYRVAQATPVSKAWKRHSAVLDQGNLGSCTGNASEGVLGTEPFFATMPTGWGQGEDEALSIYELATQLDGYSGSYPPDDTGSDGLSAAKACKQLGFISGYTHALSIDDVLSGLQSAPAIVGTNWLSAMDSPDSKGIVKYSGSVRGGHEYELAEVDMDKQLLWFWNSWGTSWGLQGKFAMSFADFTKALKDDGDATFFVPLGNPAPTPQPVPVSNADAALVAAGNTWEKTVVSKITKSGKMKTAFDNWKTAHSF